MKQCLPDAPLVRREKQTRKQTQQQRFTLPQRLLKGLLAGGVCCLGLLLQIQDAHALYKYVDANGQITYSDRPPPPGARSLATDTSGAGVANSDLPYSLRGSATRYPVTLYALSEACAPCDNARKLLLERGIPFAEKRVRNASDAAAMKKLNLPSDQFPVITVGTQVQAMFEAGALTTLLDAAGYPKSSALPSGYKHAAAQPVSGSQGKADNETQAQTAPADTKGAGKSISAQNSEKAKAERKLQREQKALEAQTAQSTIRF